METASEYMGRVNKVLAKDYRAEGSENRLSCIMIARQVERRLLAEGRQTRLYFVRNAVRKEEGGPRPIVPKRYEGRVNDWIVHVVAVADCQVFDPMLGKSVSIGDYCELAFEGKTEILPVKNPLESIDF